MVGNDLSGKQKSFLPPETGYNSQSHEEKQACPYPSKSPRRCSQNQENHRYGTDH